MVRKLIAIFFIFLFAVSSTEAGQLIKIPKLIFHYVEHKTQNGTSFTSFLQKHYFANDTDDGDENEDAQLPFKEINANCFSFVYIVPPEFDINSRLINSSSSHQLYQSPFIDNNGIFGIFHPPRHC